MFSKTKVRTAKFNSIYKIMKNLFIGLIATVLLSITNVNAKNIDSHRINIDNFDGLGKRHLEGSFTLSGGCHIKYSVDIDYQLIPPRINSIHGSVTMTGNCSGTQTFRASATTNDKGQITSVETDLKDKYLQTEEFNSAFAKSLNELRIFDEK